jgi:hypothetical protein
MQVVTRDTLGISLLQYLNASCSHAHRCSGVPSAFDVVENVATPTTPNMTTVIKFGTATSVGSAKSDSG